jgi:hypothetical protein
MARILFSRGRNTRDNHPRQLSASDFDEFVDLLDKDRSPAKGLAYICSALVAGPHYQAPEKFPGTGHWRLKNYAEPRRFLAFDFDGFSSPVAFANMQLELARWSCLFYTTASHTEEAPRARAIVELDREVSHEEGVEIGKAAQRLLESRLGAGEVKFDESVYAATQPVFTPVTTSQSFRFHGSPLPVDEVLREFGAAPAHRQPTGGGMLDGLLGGGFAWPSGQVREGGRNQALLSYVGHIRGLGLKEEEVLALARAANNHRLLPPLEPTEVEDICQRYSRQNRAHLISYPSESVEEYLECAAGTVRIPTVPPPPREYAFAGQVTLGTLSVIGGQGGASKTMLVMQACAAAAIGKDLGGLQIAQGASLLFLGEEDHNERDRRLGAICDYLEADRQLVERRIRCYAAAGLDIRLTHKLDSNPEATQFGGAVVRIAHEHAAAAEVPVKLIVFDHARLVLGGDPNSAEDVTQLTRVLTDVARKTGAAVILLAHSPKSVSSKSGDEISAADIAGSSAFVDNARAAFMMWTMREAEAKAHHQPLSDRTQFVRLENVKANYARTGGGYWFKRKFLPDWDVAVLEQATLHSPTLFESKSASALKDRILAQVRQKPGGVTERWLRGLAGKEGVLRASEGKVRHEIEVMLEEGLLDRRSPTLEERRRLKLPAGIRQVLVALS